MLYIVYMEMLNVKQKVTKLCFCSFLSIYLLVPFIPILLFLYVPTFLFSYSLPIASKSLSAGSTNHASGFW